MRALWFVDGELVVTIKERNSETNLFLCSIHYTHVHVPLTHIVHVRACNIQYHRFLI